MVPTIRSHAFPIIKLSPGGPIPHNMAKTFDGPPTLERSGSEHRVGRFSPSLLRFLSPGNGGTEGGVKTIGKGLGESGGASLKGKGGLVGFRRFLIDFIKVAKNIVIIHQLP